MTHDEYCKVLEARTMSDTRPDRSPGSGGMWTTADSKQMDDLFHLPADYVRSPAEETLQAEAYRVRFVRVTCWCRGR